MERKAAKQRNSQVREAVRRRKPSPAPRAGVPAAQRCRGTRPSPGPGANEDGTGGVCGAGLRQPEHPPAAGSRLPKALAKEKPLLLPARTAPSRSARGFTAASPAARSPAFRSAPKGCRHALRTPRQPSR